MQKIIDFTSCGEKKSIVIDSPMEVEKILKIYPHVENIKYSYNINSLTAPDYLWDTI